MYYTLKITDIEGADISRSWPILCGTRAEADDEKRKCLKANPGVTVAIITHSGGLPADDTLII